MTDKELLELAAKACGFKKVSATYHSDDDGYQTSEFWCMHVKDLYDGKSGYSCIWNPLTDDGDALRLAVKLGLVLVIESDMVFCRNQRTDKAFREPRNNDPYAATRRTIVRAAADIGKEMK